MACSTVASAFAPCWCRRRATRAMNSATRRFCEISCRRPFKAIGSSCLRKVREAILAVRLEQALSKDRILELYLNEIFLGQRAYGFAAASRIYFGKPMDKLSLAETALLAGFHQATGRVQARVARQDGDLHWAPVGEGSWGLSCT